jgi:hypothetical protein
MDIGHMDRNTRKESRQIIQDWRDFLLRGNMSRNVSDEDIRWAKRVPWSARELPEGGAVLQDQSGSILAVLPTELAEHIALLQSAFLNPISRIAPLDRASCGVCGAVDWDHESIRHKAGCPYGMVELMRSAPMPRLQLRWTRVDSSEFPGSCHYELVLPLRSADARDHNDCGFKIVPLSLTRVGSLNEPTGAPFRDGVHAQLDSEALGGLPIYVVRLDGTIVTMDEAERR